MIRHKFISKRFDEIAILAVAVKIAFSREAALDEAGYAVLAALRRSSPEWELTIEETGKRLASYSEDSIAGLVNNVKGILHEMEFVRLENEDGDSVIAALYPDTNQKSVDVQMLDEATGDAWSIQLKATDNVSAINSWIDSNPDTEILITEELSEKMGISSSGFTNQDLSIRVEEFVDHMTDIHSIEDPALWEMLPPLVAVSAGIIVFELWRRYRDGRISIEEFQRMTIKTLGLKAGKYGVLFTALAVPGLNVIAGAYMLGSFIIALNKTLDRTPTIRPFAFLAAR